MQLTCDDAEGTVTVDEATIAGRVAEGVSCPACGGTVIFYAGYETNMCNVWLEEAPDASKSLPPTPLPFLRP